MQTEGAPLTAGLVKMKELIDSSLTEMLEPVRDKVPERLYEAMTYSLTAGGKRLRPLLFLSSFAVMEPHYPLAVPYAAAVEFIHTYSLIHDDLPVMDDDDFRRGKPTCHRVFGEAVAILAGDALLTEAFRILLEQRGDGIDPEHKIGAAYELASSAGAAGMVGGQILDLALENKEAEEDEVKMVHEKKTGALIKASVVGGAILSGAGGDVLSRLADYGYKLGLAFQIVDDILDVKSSFREMGKKTGKDIKAGKATYPSAVGIKRAEEEARFLVSQAVTSVKGLGAGGDCLSEIAYLCINRKR